MPLNISIGLLGHVDSGKTSLSKALSAFSSTAAFDKNPQSQERGITLDLGFSGLRMKLPEILSERSIDGDLVFTFVDVPGHQSLIKTIISGSLIIDMMILVVDIQKGFETQTAECLILAEITKKPMLVVLNKIDKLNEHEREEVIEKIKKKVEKTLNPTMFKNSKIIPISASTLINIDLLKDVLLQEAMSISLIRNISLPFIFAFDHCFLIKGSGTVLSGTVLQGVIKVNDNIEIPHLKTERKVKSMQIFGKPVNSGSAGDRLGICVTNLDPTHLERGLVCQKGIIKPAFAVIVKLEKIRYFKRSIKTKAKFHCTVGHQTVMGSILIFSSSAESSNCFNWNDEYSYEEILLDTPHTPSIFYALIEFENNVMVHDGMDLIGSKLDTEKLNVCRIAFHGKICIENSTADKDYSQTFLPRLKVFKIKVREGLVQRVVNDYEIIASNLFKKETDRTKFVGMTCQLSTGDTGKIVGCFGQSSKVRIQLTNSLQASKVKNKLNDDINVTLTFKKFIFDKTNQMVQ